MSRTIQKVTALITRQVGNKPPDLLVFRHPLAGVQLPAGTVEAGETVEAALFREVAEETGLTQVQIVERLGILARDLDGEDRALLQKSPFLIGPAADAPSLNFTFGRGNWVRVIGQVNGYAEAVWEEYDLVPEPPQIRFRFSGWLPANLLATHLERHFFHLTLTAPTPETWAQAADNHIFQLHWVPLIPKPSLVDSQNEWLAFGYERLLEGYDS